MAAGLGFKTFTTGEVLTAADTNGYLMQGVLVFASAAARDAAITSPQEGQCCYLKDTDAVLTYSGAAWVGFDDSNAIQNSIVDAKGDLVAASGADTPARLAVGSNGETLVADSSTSTGLRYQGSMAAGRNFIINGGFDIWQRGTSIAAQQVGFNYVSDRWGASSNTSGAATVSRQATGDTTNLPFVQYCARYQRTAGNTATGIQYLNQPIETINSIPLAGKTVTVSFYARAGANFSATSNALNVSLRSGTGTDQNYLGTWTGDVLVASTTATLTTTWQRFQFSGTIGATATELTLPFTYTPTGTAGANDYYEVTGVQLEVGSIATQFSRAGATIQGELAACQRYYYLHSTGSGKGVAMGTYYSASDMRAFVGLPVTMRTTPTLSAGSGTNYYRIISAGVSTDYFNSFTLEAGYAQTAIIQNSTEVSGTAGYSGIVSCESGANSFVAFSAEL